MSKLNDKHLSMFFVDKELDKLEGKTRPIFHEDAKALSTNFTISQNNVKYWYFI